MEKVKAFADWLTKWFTVIVIVWAVFNYFVPAASLWGKAYTGYMLGIVLFGMGLTLTLDDFKRILTQPLMVIVGTVAHFIIMPLIAVALCADLPPVRPAGRGRDSRRLLPVWHLLQRDELPVPW